MNAPRLDTDTIDNQFERLANRLGWSEAERAEFGPTPQLRAAIVRHEREHADVARRMHGAISQDGQEAPEPTPTLCYSTEALLFDPDAMASEDVYRLLLDMEGTPGSPPDAIK